MSIKSYIYTILLFACLSSLAYAAPLANLSASSLDFGVQTIGTTSATQTVTLTNTGDANLVVTGTVTSGEFTSTSSCRTLTPNQSCTASVSYAPKTDPGAGQTQKYSSVGSLQFTTNATDPNTSVALIGTTDTRTCTATATNPVTFASTQVGESTAALSASITAGSVALPLDVFASGDFSQSNNCATPLAAGSTCNISVIFTPTIAGTRTGGIYANSQAHVCGFADVVLEGTGSGVGVTDKTTDIKGCSVGKNGPFDPVLALLVLAAVLRLYGRRKNN
ncbi:MAG: hypothetical protein RL020_1531 [Pseudomonadota bacterium]|jgi:Abnormal spindle-like microcephaly-assoc'd, ASPM-SPD-2-Hydin